jgi:hypothetical protein
VLKAIVWCSLLHTVNLIEPVHFMPPRICSMLEYDFYFFH